MEARTIRRGPGGRPDPGPDSGSRHDGSAAELRWEHAQSSGEVPSWFRLSHRECCGLQPLTFHLEE